MSFQFMPFYVGDYLRDTQHLSCVEHGIYTKLLMHCWCQLGPAPLDERKLCGIVNARSSDEIEALRRVLAEFFTRMVDGHYNKRSQRETEKACAISNTRSDAGKKGAQARIDSNYQASAKQVLSKSKAIAATPTPTPTSISKKKRDLAETGVSTEAAFDQFWKAYPRKVKKPTAKKAFDRINPNTDLLKAMLSAIERHRKSDQWRRESGRYIQHPASWLNAESWNDELLKATDDDVLAGAL